MKADIEMKDLIEYLWYYQEIETNRFFGLFLLAVTLAPLITAVVVWGLLPSDRELKSRLSTIRAMCSLLLSEVEKLKKEIRERDLK